MDITTNFQKMLWTIETLRAQVLLGAVSGLKLRQCLVGQFSDGNGLQRNQVPFLLVCFGVVGTDNGGIGYGSVQSHYRPLRVIRSRSTPSCLCSLRPLTRIAARKSPISDAGATDPDRGLGALCFHLMEGCMAFSSTTPELSRYCLAIAISVDNGNGKR